MNIVCEHGEKIVKGLDIYISCLITNSPCSFQRYCTSRQDVLNTEGAKSCVGRIKKDTVAEEVMVVDEKFEIEENHKELENETLIKEEVKKEYGKVVLVSKNGVFYDYNGQSRYKTGKFNFKIGDVIEL